MARTIDPKTTENYLTEVQRLKVVSTHNPEKVQELLNYIAEQKDQHPYGPEYDAFFKGEYAFYSGNYKQALAHYMQARDVPFFEFLCYRATAHVSFSRDNLKKTLNFINKALDMNPIDYSTLKLKHNILLKKGEENKAQEVLETIHTIEKEHLPEIQNTAEMPSTHNSEEQEPSPADKEEASNRFIATELGVDLDSEKALEARIQRFQQWRTDLVCNYLEESKKSREVKDQALYILNGWTEDRLHPTSCTLLEEHTRKNSGGFFFRWNGQGVVINPGTNFLDLFHSHGLYIKDIDHVIVTRDNPVAHSDIKRIYDLNYQLNKVNPDLHVINYYINHSAYQDLSHVLKPNFKQERHTLHSLELFLDSPDIETIELGDGIALNYFSTSSRESFTSNTAFKESRNGAQIHCLGVRLDLTQGQTGETLSVGYVSGTAWSPLLAHHLGPCNILITGFGHTNASDYGKLSYNERSLGYFGTYTLLEEVKPKLLLCAEFEGCEGDVRLEATRKLRKEYQTANPSTDAVPTILPADNGLFIDLKTQKIKCSVSNILIEPNEIVVTKTHETFGRLCYLSPTCLLFNDR